MNVLQDGTVDINGDVAQARGSEEQAHGIEENFKDRIVDNTAVENPVFGEECAGGGDLTIPESLGD